MSLKDPQQILVVGPSWVGDMVMAQVLLQMLRRRYPRAAIDLLSPRWAAPLGERMAEVRDSIPADLPHGALQLRVRKRIGERLKNVGYDWAIVLPSSWKSALIPYWADIDRRTGFFGECRWLLLNDRRTLDKTRLPRTVERFVSLAIPASAPMPSRLPAPQLRVDPHSQQAALERLGLSHDQPVLALAPGAEYGPAKRWPVRHFITLAQSAIAQGWAVWLFGSSKDAEITQAIAAAVPQAVDLGGHTSLTEAVDLLALAEVTVSNDSGLMHVAGAVGSRVVGLFGASSPAMTPPLGAGAQILYHGIDCSPCGKRVCPKKHHRCLEDLTPGEVIAATLSPNPSPARGRGEPTPTASHHSPRPLAGEGPGERA